MKYLVDTHLLIWLAGNPRKLSRQARAIVENTSHDLIFSAISMWEVGVKLALGRVDFRVEPRVLRRALLDRAFEELSMTSEHTFTAAALPLIHRDPFDRALVAQATVEGVTLLTADKPLADYPGPVMVV